MAETPGALPLDAPPAPPQQVHPVAPGTGAAVRRVRTAEGSRFFGIPVGAVITDTADTQRGTARQVVSTTKLASLQRQFEAKKNIGDVSLMRDLQEQFSAAVKEYVFNGGQLPDVIRTLTGARGRMSEAVLKETDPNRAKQPVPALLSEPPAPPEAPAAPAAPDTATPPEAPAPPDASTPPASGSIAPPDASTSAPSGADAGAAV